MREERKFFSACYRHTCGRRRGVSYFVFLKRLGVVTVNEHMGEKWNE